MAGLELIQIDLLEIINEMNAPKERKEEVFLALLNAKREDGEFIYEGDNITGFQLYQSMQTICITVNIDTDGTVEVKSGTNS